MATCCVMVAFSLISARGANVPASYDLRKAGPAQGGDAYTSWVTEVQNQSYQGDCWSFATATALNSNMLVKGFLETRTDPPKIEVSSWAVSANNGQAEWFTYSYGDNSGYNNAEGNYSWGGFESQAMAYLTRGIGAWKIDGTVTNKTTVQAGGGIVLDKDDSLNPFPLEAVNAADSMAPYIPRAAQQVSYLPRSITFMDQDQSGLNAADQISAVKAAIYENGAVATGMNANPAGFTDDGKNNPFYNPAMDMINFISFANVSPDHEVTIIGWDDNIDLVIKGQHYTGGWLVQNSWGTDWGFAGKGLFWASYEDPLIGRQSVTSYQVDTMKIPDDAIANAGVTRSGIVLQNQIGPLGLDDDVADGRDSFSYVMNNNGSYSPNNYSNGEHNKAASILTYDRPFQLVSVGIFSPQRANDPDNLPFAEVTFYSGWTDGAPDGQLFPSQKVTFDGIQYRMFDLENVLPLLTSIVVVVDYRNLYSTEQGSYAIPYEGYVSGMPPASLDLSFYYDTLNDKWVDLGKPVTNGVFFLKGIPAAFPALEWNGAASGGDWIDGTNWKDGGDTPVVWSNENDVRFEGMDSSATVTLNTDAEIGDLIYKGESGDSLTLAAGTGSLALRYKKTSFFINTGTTLNVETVLTDWGSEERELILTGGTTVFSSAQAYTGKTQINYSATLALAGTAGDIAGDIDTYGTLSLQRTNDYTLAKKVTGPGGVTIDTPAKVSVTHDQEYTGYTIISSGTLALISGKLSDETPVDNKGGIFDISGLVDDHTKVGSIEGAGAFVLGDKTLEVGRNDMSTTVSGIISGNAGSKLLKEGKGRMTLSGANTLSGSIEISKGTLIGASSGAFGDAHVKLKSDGVLENGLAGGATLAIVGDLDLEGGQITLGALSEADAVFSIGGTLRTSGANTLFLNELDASGSFLIFSGGGTTASLSNFLFVFGDSDSDLSGVSLGYSGGDVVMTVSPDASITGSFLNVRSSFITFIPSSAQVVVTDGAMVGNLIFNNSALFTGGAFTLASGLIDTGSSTVKFYNTGVIVTDNLTKQGSGDMFIYDNFLVAGDTLIQEGLLKVEGSLTTQDLYIEPGAELGGSGQIFGNVYNDGLLAPGSSPGTLTISGNLTLGITSTVELEIASLSVFDRIIVSGTATLNGTLDVIPFGGFDLEYGQQFQFLTANTVRGEFDDINAPDGFRGRILIDAGDVTLLIAPESYTLLAANPNQRNVARALDGFIAATSGDRREVSTALDLMTADGYEGAFNAIMPSFYETLGSLSLSATTTLGQLIDQRLSAVRLGARGFSVQGMGNMPTYTDRAGKSVLDGRKDILSPAEDNPWSVWVLGNGIFGHSYSVANIPNYRYASGGILVGGDYRWSEQFATGAFVGYQGAYSTYANDGKVSMNSVNFGGYATYDAGNGLYASGIVMGGYTNYQARRPINFSTIDRTASSNPGSGNVAALLETGYDFKVGGFTFGPVINAQYSYVGVSPFTEYGAESLDLRVGQQNLNSIQTNIGARIAYTWNVTSSIVLIPELRVFWNHEFLQNPTTFDASLDGGSGSRFDYTTTAPARDSVFAGVGVNAQIGDRWNASVYYNANFGSATSTTNAISASLGFNF